MDGIIIAGLIVGGTGLVIGILLGIAGKFFAVPVNEKELLVREALPGNNCGGCGYAGCDGYAAAVVNGEAAPNLCPVGGAKVAEELGKILGIEVSVEKKIAYVKCSGTCDIAPDKYEYHGSKSCVEAMSVTGFGPKKCSYGCMGLGSCVNVCEFEAISVVNGIAVVDPEKCTACGKCAKVCPKHLIDIVPYESKYHVSCNNKDKGKDVKAVCSAGCIGCGICAKNCQFDAVSVTDNLATIDYVKCKNCGVCANKCPVKIIK